MLSRLTAAFDPYILALLGTVAFASFLPAQGGVAHAVEWAANAGIVLLFFLHGAKLSREAALAGAGNWRLHLSVMGATFVMFPLLGLAMTFIPGVDPIVASGILFLTLLPSTVQSSVAFTSIAKGNVAAAICSASFSNLIGLFITPLLTALLMHGRGAGVSVGAVEKIVAQLLLPFVAGQLLRPMLGKWIERHRSVTKFVDQGSILLVVYGAFSEAVTEGLWRHTSLGALGGLVLINAVLLALALAVTMFTSKRLGFNRADQITIIFCGSKKSLASGVPMAKVIFASHAVGAAVLPLMLFHQIQLMVCAALAQRWGARDTSAETRAAAEDHPAAAVARR